MIKKWFKKLLDLLEKPLPYFFTFSLRPKKAEKIGVVPDDLVSFPKLAIVIQGPIIYDQDFTFETIQLYKKIFPNAKIILSTWNYEQSTYLQKIKDKLVDVVLSQPPERAGVSYVNYQIVSSLAGICRAKELGVEYILKTRTDQRIYHPGALEFLVNIVEKFLPANGYKQNKRIVGTSLNTFKFRNYGLSDMNLFGQVDDILKYFSLPLDNDGSGFLNLHPAVSEVYLSSNFLRSVGKDLKWTLYDSWEAFRDNFCVVDEQSLDLYWYKYSRMKEYRYRRYQKRRNDEPITFADWFSIFSNLNRKNLSTIEKDLIRVIP